METLVSEVARALRSIAEEFLVDSSADLYHRVHNVLATGKWMPLKIIIWCSLSSYKEFDHISLLLNLPQQMSVDEYFTTFTPGMSYELGSLLLILLTSRYLPPNVTAWVRSIDRSLYTNECRKFINYDSRLKFVHLSHFVFFMKKARDGVLNGQTPEETEEDDVTTDAGSDYTAGSSTLISRLSINNPSAMEEGNMRQASDDDDPVFDFFEPEFGQ